MAQSLMVGNQCSQREIFGRTEDSSLKSLVTYTNTTTRKGVRSWKRNSWRWPCECRPCIRESWDSSLAHPSSFIWSANEKHTDNTCSYIRPSEQIAMSGLSTNACQLQRIMHRFWLHYLETHNFRGRNRNTK